MNAADAIRAAGRTTLGELFRHRARAHRDRLAGALIARAATRGDRVALLARNCAEYLEVELACAKIGAITVALNWRLGGHELAHCINLVETRLLLYREAFSEAIDRLDIAVAARISLGETYERMLAGASAAPQASVDQEDGLVLLYTSGTTGLPEAP